MVDQMSTTVLIQFSFRHTTLGRWHRKVSFLHLKYYQSIHHHFNFNGTESMCFESIEDCWFSQFSFDLMGGCILVCPTNYGSMKYGVDQKSFYWFSDAHYCWKKLQFMFFSYQVLKNADWIIHIITRLPD